MWCVKGCLGAAVFDNCACAILEELTPAITTLIFEVVFSFILFVLVHINT